MDSLTKRLLLNSGMVNTGPLPPLLSSTTRLVYPDETLKKSEIDLYSARKALKHLEDGLEQLLDKNEILKRTETVRSAIVSLGPSEGRYFQTRYVKNSVVLKRVMRSRRRADSEAALRAAEARSRATEERARKAEEDLEEERKRDAVKEEEEKKAQAEIVTREEQKAANAAQKAARRKEHAEGEKKRKLEAEKAEQRRTAWLANVKAVAAAAQRAADALKENHKKQTLLAEQEELAEKARKQAEIQKAELAEKRKKIEQIKNDLIFAQELAKKDRLKAELDAELEEAKRLAKDNEKQKEIDEQMKADMAMAERIYQEDLERFKEAEKKVEEQTELAKKAGALYEWYNKNGWRDKWEIVNVPGDGNCLFHAICVAMGKKDNDCHKGLRRATVDYIKANLDSPWQDESAVPGDAPSTWRSVITETAPHALMAGFQEIEVSTVDKYLEVMGLNSTWGTDFEIRAMVAVLDKPLNIVMEYPKGRVSHVPDIDGDANTIHIYHKTPGAHYMAIVPK